jgi:RNA polymerase sigma-70 factor (ECF subfamily)
MEEKELIRLSQSGNGEAFGQLVERYKTKVFSLAYGVTRDRAAADDLAQEIFIKAYFALPKFKFQSEFGTWLYRVTMNHIKDFLRKNRSRQKEVSLEDISERAVATEDQSYEADETAERRRTIVQAALKRLPEKHQVILALRDMQGLSYEEISRILGISPGTVDSRLHRARKKLREKLAVFTGRKGGGDELQ